MPVFAAVGAVLASVGTAVGASAATATMTGALIAGSAVTAGLGIAESAGAFSSKASTINPNPTATAAQTVSSGGSNPNSTNLGRAALIATSPQGVQGSDPSNRYAFWARVIQ